MKEVTVIFPHQLFEEHPALDKKWDIYLVEEPHFFTRYSFHRQKLIFHKATMDEYRMYLTKKGYKVTYVTLEDNLIQLLTLDRVTKIHCTYVYDHTLDRSIKIRCSKAHIAITWYESPYFVSSLDDFKRHFANKDSFYFTSFYHEQRKKHSILMTKSGKPKGGKFSFDPENRQRLPKSVRIPRITPPKIRRSVEEARTWATKFNHPGSTDECMYPVTFADAKQWLKEFLASRLKNFGPYQDALSTEQSILFHSVLSPLLNSGLLTPRFVIDSTISYAQKHRIPLNSLEGFIRQILGWREFVYGIYHYKGREQQKSNFFNATNKVPDSFWDGTTGIEPIDITIKRVLTNAYAHHIERLMLFGNFMLLCEIDPNEVYRWFMELYIDAYDWVMIPNVYGMSQYADGGLMTTKPYISGANYLKKMSNYPKGAWEDTFTDLYWRFLVKHRKKLEPIPRMRLMTNRLKTIDSKKLTYHTKQAEKFLKTLLKEHNG